MGSDSMPIHVEILDSHSMASIVHVNTTIIFALSMYYLDH